MKYSVIDLKEKYSVPGGKLKAICMDTPYDSPSDWRRPAVIVCPGGGYNEVCSPEGEPVANKFLARGFQTFVLTYNVHKEGYVYPTQLLELACAVDYVRKNANEYNVKPDEIFVMGFSAGGHLAGSLAVGWQDASALYGSELDCRPAAVGLCYPVVSHKLGHVGSHENLLDGYTDEQKEELYKKLDLNEAVTENTPPAFIWSTSEDSIVPSQNALQMALAYAEQGMKYELHIYAGGDHGLSTCDLELNWQGGDTYRNAKWVDDCEAFFRLFTK